MKVRSLTIYDAVQWHRHGDHPDVRPYGGKEPDLRCAVCNYTLRDHGRVMVEDGGDDAWPVCPGDYVVQDLTGKHAVIDVVARRDLSYGYIPVPNVR